LKLSRVKISQLKIPEVRVTAYYDDESAKLLKDSLAAMGTINPVVVIQDGEELIVVDGKNRVVEARERGDTDIDCVIRPGDATTALLQNLVLNKVRGRTKASEMVAVIGSLTQDHGLSSDEIGEKTGLSRDYIEKLQKIALASPFVQQSLDEELIGVGQAYEISRLPYATMQEELIAKAQVFKWPVSEVRDQVNAVLEAIEDIKAHPRPPAAGIEREPRIYTCEGCKQEADPRYLRPVMLCPDCFGKVWRLAKASAEGEGEPKQFGSLPVLSEPTETPGGDTS